MHRYKNFNVTVGFNPEDEDKKFDPDENEYCGGGSSTSSAKVEITCIQPIDGRYVTIRNGPKILTLCEVLVYGEQGELYIIMEFS